MVTISKSCVRWGDITDDEALAILNCPDDELLLLLQGAYRIRKTYYGNKVKLNMIMNAKSGLCPENCGYCSQSSISTAPIPTYKMVNKETILQGAKRAYEGKIGTYCIVASGRDRAIKKLISLYLRLKKLKKRTA